MLPTIRSSSNQRVKAAIDLRSSRQRRKTGLILIDGVREILRAKKSGVKITELYLSVSGQGSFLGEIRQKRPDLVPIVEEFEEKRIPVWPIVKDVFAKLAFGERDEGIVALAEKPLRSLETFQEKLPEKPLIAVLEKIEKPGNIGAVFRSADGAGIHGIILAEPLTDLFHPNIIRSSLGTVFRIPSVSLSTEETLAWLRQKNIQIVSAICGAKHSYLEVDYRKPSAIVLGNEANGLSRPWFKSKPEEENRADISLPMLGIADSLNISNAAAILFYNARAQRSGVLRRIERSSEIKGSEIKSSEVK